MKCASCDENLSIIQSLVGHNCEDRQRELEQLALQRLLDATTPDESERVEIKLEKISVVAQSHGSLLFHRRILRLALRFTSPLISSLNQMLRS